MRTRGKRSLSDDYLPIPRFPISWSFLCQLCQSIQSNYCYFVIFKRRVSSTPKLIQGLKFNFWSCFYWSCFLRVKKKWPLLFHLRKWPQLSISKSDRYFQFSKSHRNEIENFLFPAKKMNVKEFFHLLELYCVLAPKRPSKCQNPIWIIFWAISWNSIRIYAIFAAAAFYDVKGPKMSFFLSGPGFITIAFCRILSICPFHCQRPQTFCSPANG